MFKYKIKIILKSGYEIRVKVKEPHYTIGFDKVLKFLESAKPNYKNGYIIESEIAAIIVKNWYQRWD